MDFIFSKSKMCIKILSGEEKITTRKWLMEDIQWGKYLSKDCGSWAFGQKFFQPEIQIHWPQCFPHQLLLCFFSLLTPHNITPFPLEDASSPLKVLSLLWLFSTSFSLISCKMDQISLFKILSSFNILGTSKEIAYMVV